MIGFSRNAHLDELVVRSQSAAARLASAPPEAVARARAQARRAIARYSARLDGSPLEEETAVLVDQREDAGDEPSHALAASLQTPAVRVGWAGALRLDELPTQEVAAAEYANLLACFDAEAEIAGWIYERPFDALRALHTGLCADLVAPEHIGTPRTTQQAVHDGAQGRVVYYAPDPAQLPELLDELADWLATAAHEPLMVAGVLHERILEWQPFEAANGRLARAASRVILRAQGLDPHGLAVVEEQLALDPAGYYGEVAATIRRRGDLTGWLERYAESAVTALERAAAVLQPVPAPPFRYVADLDAGQVVTVADYASSAGVAPAQAGRELAAMVTAGLLRHEPGARGLRFRVEGP